MATRLKSPFNVHSLAREAFWSVAETLRQTRNPAVPVEPNSIQSHALVGDCEDG